MAVSAAAKTRSSMSAKRIWLCGALSFAFILALAWIARENSEITVAGFGLWQIFVIAGILFFSGLMSGLSGFGFSAVGSACLLLIPPKIAVPLLMALSTANQLMSVGQLREDMPKTLRACWPHGPGPVVVGGIAGVPAGIWLLNHLPSERLMILFGILLTGYSAYSPDVSGCVAVGDTEQETRRNFQEALVAHFEAMREVGEPIPEPHTLVDYVEVAA